MPSNISLISAEVLGSPWIARAAPRESNEITCWADAASSSSSRHSGCHASIGLRSIHVANPSFSHMSSHHAAVTRSPNHWCADIWLNEGFATWMERKPIEAWHPEWRLED